MKLEIAKMIVEILEDCDRHFNDLLDAVEFIEDEEERGKLRRIGADLVGRIYTDILMPIEEQYPELRKS